MLQLPHQQTARYPNRPAASGWWGWSSIWYDYWGGSWAHFFAPLLWEGGFSGWMLCYVECHIVDQACHRFPDSGASLWAWKTNPYQKQVSSVRRKETARISKVGGFQWSQLAIKWLVVLLKKHCHFRGLLSIGFWCWRVGQWTLDAIGHY